MKKQKKALDALLSTRDVEANLANDPLSFVHRYSDIHDQELAAVFASTLAYGRVTLFFPIIRALLDEADRHGGPRAWIDSFDKKKSDHIAHIYYRLNKFPDFSLLALGLKGIREQYGHLA